MRLTQWPTFSSDCDAITVDSTQNDSSDNEDKDTVVMEDNNIDTKTEEVATEPSGMKDNSNSRPPGVGDNLTSEEEEATKKFLENVNKWRSARELEEVVIIIVKIVDKTLMF